MLKLIKDFFIIRRPERRAASREEGNRTILFFSLAFFIPFAVVIAGAIIRGLAPFGENTLMAIDAWGQYFPMLREMKRAFRSLDMSYSFSGALGFDLSAQSAYYTNSPLWYLLFLIPGELTPGQVDMMVFIRFALAGLTFTCYLSEHYNKKSPLMIFAALGYAFSGYTLAFINQFMWMDAVVLLPLVLLGIERLYKGKGLLLYTVSLGLTIYSNFYIAYAVCIFSVLWFFLLAFTEGGSFRSFFISALRFGVCSLAAGAANIGVLLPMLRAISNTLASDMGFGGKLELYHSLKDMLSMLLPFNEASLGYGVPNIYFGISLAVMGVAAIFSRAGLRKKLGFGFLLLFMFVSFNFNLLDYIWHGFHYPNQLPARQSFLFIFTALVIAYKGIEFLLENIKEEKYRKIAAVIICVIICADVVPNAVNRFANGRISVVESSVLRNSESLSVISHEYGSDKDENEFWRIETVPNRYNNGQIFGFNGISHYSSTMSGRCYNFFLQLGMNRYAKNVSTEYIPDPVVNSLLGVRYIAAATEYNDGISESVGIAANMTVYENSAVLPLFYVADSAVCDVDMSLKGYAFTNDIFKRAAATEDVIWGNGIFEKDCNGKNREGYELNKEEFLKGIERILESSCEITDFGKTSIRGTVKAVKDGVLLVTLPYEDIEIEIDGRNVETFAVAGYLAGAYISAGDHEITIKLP